MIIGIGHRQGQGKDTLGRFINAEIRDKTKGISVECRSFAFKIKEMAYSLYSWAGIERADYYEINHTHKDVFLPKLGKTPRTLWIDLGNKLREMDEDIWINSIMKNNCPDILILRDLRYPYEAIKIKEAGGILIKCIRPDVALVDDSADSAMKDWTEWDYESTSSDLKEAHEHSRIIVERFCKKFLKS